MSNQNYHILKYYSFYDVMIVNVNEYATYSLRVLEITNPIEYTCPKVHIYHLNAVDTLMFLIWMVKAQPSAGL